VNYPETYEVIFSRLRQELGAAASSSSPIQHLIVVLGIPIAYPVRLPTDALAIDVAGEYFLESHHWPSKVYEQEIWLWLVP
jgi:hypothetical protein